MDSIGISGVFYLYVSSFYLLKEGCWFLEVEVGVCLCRVDYLILFLVCCLFVIFNLNYWDNIVKL